MLGLDEMIMSYISNCSYNILGKPYQMVSGICAESWPTVRVRAEHVFFFATTQTGCET